MNKRYFEKTLVPLCLGAYSLTLSWLHGTTTTLYTQAWTAGPVHTVVQPKLQISPLLYTVKKWGCLLQTGTPDIASPIKGGPLTIFHQWMISVAPPHFMWGHLKLYIPSTLNIDLILCVQKMLNHGLNHGFFLSLFKLISCPRHWIVYVLAYLNFKAVLALPKTARSA